LGVRGIGTAIDGAENKHQNDKNGGSVDPSGVTALA
jgi:hypothetical protein